ncbi:MULTISPECIES: adenosine deaminase [Halocynthiibacter]|uniref:Adenosine deaminase n=1 Tax=Halocynthiibacter halioticoli TaxID=2986804 RepID=A0AAE3J214_9RHOB|nr:MULTISPECIES: adenosine deaminase [Halocynthiibacter]MCV6825201.1 adenosine deaminase [Halocynthiibacter halioticoli]MCW4058202.1 adenosine deaminase [Halocynthiibacter sp. SDUM655004]
MSILELPKVELHLHLEGAAPPTFIRGLAQEKGVPLEGVFDDDGHYQYKDFWDFLKVYEAATACLQTPQDFARLTTAVLEECAANGVVYAETFLAPDFCGGGDVAAWKEYLHAIQEAADAAERDLGVTLRGIVTAVRHFGADQSRKTALCAAETAGDWVVGFGMGGDEKYGEPKDYAYAFDMAREAKLQLTSHAGEWNGPDEVRASIRDLGIKRVGHGVRAIEDADLIREIKDKGVALEVCPGSNVALGVYSSWDKHPIDLLRKSGVTVSVSTDDPPFFHTTMKNEYDMLNKTFGWDESIFRELNKSAISSAFCSEETRSEIEKKLEAA